MKWNYKNLAFGILFIILAVFSVLSFFSHTVIQFTNSKTYAVCGTIVFTFVGIAFLKRAKL